MAKVYSAPIKAPEFNGKSWEAFEAEEAKYLEDVKTWVKANATKSPYAGEIVRLPHADGYAQYMIVSLRPAVLIHLAVGDAWQVPAAHERGLTAKDLKTHVDNHKKLEALFGK